MRRTVRSNDRPEHEVFGRILREARESAGLTQRQVAKALDRTQAYVWKVESGIQHIDIPTLLDFARATGTIPEDLLSSLRKQLPD